jgi:preprotein translocase subunit SecB
MKNSPLQLERYFVTEFSLTANKEFDSKKEIKLGIENIVVTPALVSAPSNPRQWQVTLRIQLQPNPDANAPYFFTLELVGLFRVSDAYPEENVEWIVQTNATSVLYSAAREVLRSAMAQGPYPPFLLPTASFYGPNPNKPATPPTEDKATATK